MGSERIGENRSFNKILASVHCASVFGSLSPGFMSNDGGGADVPAF